MADIDKPEYPPACPHEPMRKIGPDIFFVPGSIQLNPLMRISRNMVIVRNGGELALLNPIRLSAEGEAAMEALGIVRHVVRLGALHGIDDPYTVTRFGAEFWCQTDSDIYPQPKPDHELAEGGPLPFADAELFVFRQTRSPECAVLLNRGDGVLVTCDSLQHYGDYDRCSLAARLIMPLIGFPRRALVGPFWLRGQAKSAGAIRTDFERLLEIKFDALISAHGTPLMQGAREAARHAVERAFK